jgi:integrase/recombinase XerD
MRKMNEQNERIKRRYLQYLKTAQRKDATTVQKAAEGILRFEASTKFADFKRFRIEQAIKFQERLRAACPCVQSRLCVRSAHAAPVG